MTYTPSRSEFLTIRGLRSHIRHWGREGASKMFMLHGWMDVGASFQFVVDALQGDWHVIAPDWRGFGLSQRSGADTYWFPDYLADLDAIVRHYAPGQAINLLGHSMGGNVVGLYAGARPERIRKLINLEGAGLRAHRPEQTPGRYAQWLEGLQQQPELRSYPTLAAVAARLQKTNPRLSDEKAAFLAQHWAAQNAAGQWDILGDPVHKQAGPLPYHVEDVLACWDAITAPVLWVEADQTNMWDWLGAQPAGRGELDRRLGHLRHLQRATLVGAGHMLHHDQPAALARLIEDFLAD
ncbi:alpha/beta hydrolase [Duganella sp. Leaf126]|uniref:alpha/beta fold hydrolase n=1 Tax=Duganella sp. Leaf126 TaxID=1736266 RepID=UPI0006F48123|nr:alpha/beta hydrolase [Duganella sp. Leaf126]KQQ33345.1 alpha/beta hydrolase [Duganella sp. Leaf126]